MSCAPFLMALSSSGKRHESVSRVSSVHSMISSSSPLMKSMIPIVALLLRDYGKCKIHNAKDSRRPCVTVDTRRCPPCSPCRILLSFYILHFEFGISLFQQQKDSPSAPPTRSCDVTPLYH